MKKIDIEKSLKRFLKRKVSYSLSLLIAFMITGGISIGAEITAEEIQESKGDLLKRIQIEREEIKRKIAENERLIKEYNSNFVELVRKGDFYSKPLFNSVQVFFSYQHLDSGKMKDVTDKEFAETIDAINKHYGTRSGRSILKSTGNIGKDKLMAGNGVAVDTEVFRETIEIGANIKPVEPVLPEINPNVSVNVSAPIVTLSGLPGTIELEVEGINEITPVNPGPISKPKEVNVNVSTPSAIDKVVVTPPKVEAPVAPTEKNLTVSAPTAPGGYEPSYISVPGKPLAPTTPEISLFTPFNISFSGTGFGQGTGKSVPTSNIVMQNFERYNTTEEVIISAGTGTSWTGIVTTETGDSLASGNTGSNLNAFISHVDDRDAVVNGNYKLTGNSGGNNTKIFASVNPYMTGSSSSEDKTFDFAGTLTLVGNGTGGTEALVGMEHQLLANGGGGGSNYGNTNKADGTTHILRNSGTIDLQSGTNMVAIMIDTEYFNGDISGTSNSAFVKLPQTINEGIIKISKNATKSIGIDYGFFYLGTGGYGPNSTVSIGTIQIDGTGNYGVRLNDYSTRSDTYGRTGTKYYDLVRLEGTANKSILVEGENNIGISIAQGRSSDDPTGGEGHLNSSGVLDHQDLIANLNVTVGGNENVGFYRNPNYTGTNHNAMTLNSSKIGDFKFTTTATNSALFRSDLDEIILTKNLNLITGSTGNSIMQAGGSGKVTNQATIASSLPTFYGLTAGDFKTSTGATASNTGIITLTGNNSLGLAIAAGNTGNNSGTVNFTGTGGSGIYNRGTFNLTDGSVINIEGTTSSGIYNLKPIGGTSTINISGTVKIAVKKGATAIYSNGGTITSTSGNSLTISVDDTSNPTTRGLAVYAEGGANLDLRAANIKVTEGAAGVAAFGENTNINLSGGKVEFDGSGYAVYSDGNGKIDLRGATVILGGSSTAFDLNLGGVSPIKLDSNSKINVVSDDVVVFNLQNVPGLNTDDLQGTITGALETAIGGELNLDSLLENSTADNYKTAAVDGGAIAIGDLDKTGTGTGAVEESDAQKAGNFYYNRFLGQRLVATATGSRISAVLNNEQAGKYNNQVVGLEMNSSSNAIANTEAAIKLLTDTAVTGEGSIIIADRTEAGSGAIGAYINYGIVEVDGKSSIKVEKENNTANDGAVGIYAVNGSEVSNAGTIDVGGSQSIGILGMAYRETLNEAGIAVVVGAEYGDDAIGQGKVTITNTGNIALDGTGTIGIYVNNNNTGGAAADNVVTNDTIGTIIVGDSDNSAAAIGIYGKKATIANKGNITVGSGGVAIYATEGSNITTLGTLKLGSDGIGVMLDGTSTIAATASTVTLESKENTVDINGKTGIFYKGTATGSDSQSIDLDINASNFVKGTAIYVQDMNVTSSGALTVGTEGIGIFVAKTGAGPVISRIGTNQGTIELEANEKAIGMYGKDTTIANETGNGIINVGNSSQIGMYADGANGKAINKGTIKLKVDGATGIYVKSGATAELDTNNNIVFDGKSSIGIYGETATVNFKSDVNFANNNENKNIYVYGKDFTVEITDGKTVTVNGMGTPTTLGNKTVGIYLENAEAGSTFKGTGELKVENGAIGIYSKGNNDLTVKVTATGDKTTGVFIDGTSTISGTVTAKTDAIGVYGSGNETGKAVNIGTRGLTLNIGTVNDKGTGMYLTDGAYATGGKITVNNSSDASNIGVYYSKGNIEETVTNESKIELTGKNGVGIYAADGITLVNNSDITSSTNALNSIASYIGGNSTFISKGAISLSDGKNGIGIYVESGTGINSTLGKITLNRTTRTMVGMVSKGAGALVENQGTITAKSNLGMYIAGTSIGINKGKITATTGTGVYIEGSGNSFDGTGGTIESKAVGIYLKDTTAGTVTNTGTLDIASGGVGVFGENANIDFNVNVTGIGAVGVTASGDSVISGKVTTGDGSVGVYVLDSNVSFNGAVIETGEKVTGRTSVGILFDRLKMGAYSVDNVTVNAKNGVGIYLQGLSGTALDFGGTIATAGAGAVGIYVDSGTMLTTDEATFKISNGAVGVYVATAGTANLGTTGDLVFNFGDGGGTGVYNNGGTLNLGNNISTTGSGSLAATMNGDLTSSGNLNIGEGGTALLGSYDNTAGNKSITNESTGNIIAESGGIGIAAIKKVGSSPLADITINNAGTITVSGKSSGGDSSIGIYTDVAVINNTNTINVGTDGIGIYAADSGKAVKNDNMTMTGDNGIGVYIKGENRWA